MKEETLEKEEKRQEKKKREEKKSGQNTRECHDDIAGIMEIQQIQWGFTTALCISNIYHNYL